jgi:hypothetical protein
MTALAPGDGRADGRTDPVARKARVAHAAVLVQYLALVISAPLWVKLEPVRDNIPDIRLFHVFLSAIFLYTCVFVATLC